MNPIDVAWSVLKALPEQQMYGHVLQDPIQRGPNEWEYSQPPSYEPDLDDRRGTMHPAIAGLEARRNPESWSDLDRQIAQRARHRADIERTSRGGPDYTGYTGMRDSLLDRPFTTSTGMEAQERYGLMREQPHFPMNRNPFVTRTQELYGHDPDLINPETGDYVPLPQHTYVPPPPSYPSYKPSERWNAMQQQWEGPATSGYGTAGMPEDIPSDWDERHPWE